MLYSRTDSPKNKSEIIVEDKEKQTLQRTFSIVQFDDIDLVWFNINGKTYTTGSLGRTYTHIYIRHQLAYSHYIYWRTEIYCSVLKRTAAK
jgi:hypothetical protein